MRNIKEMQVANDGTRTLLASALVPELVSALSDWNQDQTCHDVLIGGLAMSYWVKPRYTQDVDLLILNHDVHNIADSPRFKRIRPHAFEHRPTGVEIEVLTPEFLNLPVKVAESVTLTAVLKSGQHIASPKGLIALKLARFSLRDQADIQDLMPVMDTSISEHTFKDWGLSSRMHTNWLKSISLYNQG